MIKQIDISKTIEETALKFKFDCFWELVEGREIILK